MTMDYGRAAVAGDAGAAHLADIRAGDAGTADAADTDAAAVAVAVAVASILRVLAAAADAADTEGSHYKADAIRYAVHLVAADAPRGAGCGP